MKRCENGEALAKEFGLKPEVLKKTFEDYNESVRSKKDPFGKKVRFSLSSCCFCAESSLQFFSGEWKFDDFFHVAIMTPVLHYTMGGLQIDPESRVLDPAGKPIPGLFAAGEVAGGVHGANRLGGSSLLGCVVFGRVSGDSASAYQLQTSLLAIEKAGGRLDAIAGQLGAEKPAAAPPSPAKSPSAAPDPATPDKVPKQETSNPIASENATAGDVKAFSADEVAKHNTQEDCWVIIGDEVLDVTKVCWPLFITFTLANASLPVHA